MNARKEGKILWDWIEDRLRRPRHVQMWDGLGDFAETMRSAYRRNVWGNQPAYVEVWLEKDALSGIFEDVLKEYGVTLNVGRGFDGWDSIRKAALRFKDCQKPVSVLYFGDFDPSGEDMVRSLQERLDFFECRPQILKCALTFDDVGRYKLPTDFTKKKDTRSAAFVARYGDISVELDALPLDVLTDRLRQEVESRLDMGALSQVREKERQEKEQLVTALRGL